MYFGVGLKLGILNIVWLCMKNYIISSAAILNFALISCASADISKSRSAYITSRDHGWIELSVNDNAIPPRPPYENEKDYTPTPPYCSITVKLNNEQFISEKVYPFGQQPPYSLATGFRFPVPVGDFKMDVIYSGCRFAEDGESSFAYTAHVNIVKDFVTPVRFDGSYLAVGNQTENSSVTLEDINERLDQIERNVQSE